MIPQVLDRSTTEAGKQMTISELGKGFGFTTRKSAASVERTTALVYHLALEVSDVESGF